MKRIPLTREEQVVIERCEGDGFHGTPVLQGAWLQGFGNDLQCMQLRLDDLRCDLVVLEVRAHRAWFDARRKADHAAALNAESEAATLAGIRSKVSEAIAEEEQRC